MLDILVPPQQFLRVDKVDERSDPDLDVAPAKRRRPADQRRVAIRKTLRLQHDVNGTEARRSPTAVESPRKWRDSRPPSIFIPSGTPDPPTGPEEVECVRQTVKVRSLPGRHEVDVDRLHGDSVEPGHVTAEHYVVDAVVVQHPAQVPRAGGRDQPASARPRS